MAYQIIMKTEFLNGLKELKPGLSIKEQRIIKDSCELIANFGKDASHENPIDTNGIVACYFIFPFTLIDFSYVAARYENYVPNFTPSTTSTDWTPKVQEMWQECQKRELDKVIPGRLGFQIIYAIKNNIIYFLSIKRKENKNLVSQMPS